MAAIHPKRVRVLIVAQPGRLTNGLRTLLADSEIEVVGEVVQGSVLAETVGQTNPVLVVIAANIVWGSFADMIAQIRKQQHHIYCLVLVDNHRQQLQALQAGADATLLKGFDESELLTTITKMLSSPEVNL